MKFAERPVHSRSSARGQCEPLKVRRMLSSPFR
jgi:hypothetical protein